MSTGTRDPVALAFQADEHSITGLLYGGDGEDGLNVASSITLNDDLEEDNAREPSASVEPSSGLRRNVRPCSGFASVLPATVHSNRLGVVAKFVLKAPDPRCTVASHTSQRHMSPLPSIPDATSSIVFYIAWFGLNISLYHPCRRLVCRRACDTATAPRGML